MPSVSQKRVSATVASLEHWADGTFCVWTSPRFVFVGPQYCGARQTFWTQRTRVQLWPFLKLYVGPFGGKNGFHNQHYKKVIYNEVDEWWFQVLYVSEHAFLQIKCKCWWTSIILYRTSTFLHSKTPQFLTSSQINNLLEILSLKRCNLLWKHHQGWREQMNSDCQTQKILPQLTNLMIDGVVLSGGCLFRKIIPHFVIMYSNKLISTLAFLLVMPSNSCHWQSYILRTPKVTLRCSRRDVVVLAKAGKGWRNTVTSAVDKMMLRWV